MESNFKLLGGIPGWGQDILVIKAKLDKDGIMFYKSAAIPKPEQSTHLDYSQIRFTNLYMKAQTVEKSKSIIGRALLGTLFFGTTGGLLGAASGVDKRKVKKYRTYYTIYYKNSRGIGSRIDLAGPVIGFDAYNFDAELKRHLPEETTHKEVTPKNL